jgi:hypothetical protein
MERLIHIDDKSVPIGQTYWQDDAYRRKNVGLAKAAPFGYLSRTTRTAKIKIIAVTVELTSSAPEVRYIR